jgi:hypothetical protein
VQSNIEGRAIDPRYLHTKLDREDFGSGWDCSRHVERDHPAPNECVVRFPGKDAVTHAVRLGPGLGVNAGISYGLKQNRFLSLCLRRKKQKNGSDAQSQRKAHAVNIARTLTPQQVGNAAEKRGSAQPARSQLLV